MRGGRSCSRPMPKNDLTFLGLVDLADHIVSSARGVAKPDRKIYEIAAEQAGVAMDRCLFVNDRLENVEAAVACGMSGRRPQQRSRTSRARDPDPSSDRTPHRVLLLARPLGAPGGS